MESDKDEEDANNNLNANHDDDLYGSDDLPLPVTVDNLEDSDDSDESD